MKVGVRACARAQYGSHLEGEEIRHAVGGAALIALRGEDLPAGQHVQQPEVGGRLARVRCVLRHLQQLRHPLHLQQNSRMRTAAIRCNQ